MIRDQTSPFEPLAPALLRKSSQTTVARFALGVASTIGAWLSEEAPAGVTGGEVSTSIRKLVPESTLKVTARSIDALAKTAVAGNR